jgi:LuxR family transcriptional regulator, maltose regulon positive regulatory protein
LSRPVESRAASLPPQVGAAAVLEDLEDGESLPFEVIAAKIQAPRPAPGAVSRTAVVNLLRAARAARLVSVVAPGGYGKTTLLAQWAARDDRRFAWLLLDRRDNDPAALLRHVVAAMHAIGRVEPDVLEAVTTPDVSIWESVVPRVTAMLARTEDYVLVLDDAHLVDHGESAEIVAALADHVPEGCALVVSGRAETTIAARKRVGGQLLELHTCDLMLTRREAELLLRGMGLQLPAAVCTALVDRTEGWAGALFLAALSARDGRTSPDAFTGDDRTMADFFYSEYLSALSPEELTFLRRTSVLDKMSGALCDAVLETSRSGERLETMRRSNLFLVPLDPRGAWYRYHRLFRDLLRRELAETEPDLISVLGRRAAMWFDAHDDAESAIDHALAARELDCAADLLERIAVPTYCGGRGATVTRWLDAFDRPPLLERHPGLAVLGARINAFRGSGAAAERWLAAAEGSPVGDALLEAHSAVVRALLCREGPEAMLSDAQSAVASLPEGDDWLGLALLVNGAAELLMGDNDRADALLEQAVSSAHAHSLDETEVISTSLRVWVAEEAHDCSRADLELADLSGLLESGALDTSPPCTIQLATSARAYLRHGDSNGARGLLERAAHLTPLLTDAVPWLAVLVRLELCSTYVALRAVKAAESLLAEIDDILERRPELGVLVAKTEALRAALEAMPVLEHGRDCGLTPAELRLLPFLTTHLTFREIGERLFLSRNTIKTQAISVYRKLNVSTRSEAIEEAAALGLVDESARIPSLAH